MPPQQIKTAPLTGATLPSLATAAAADRVKSAPKSAPPSSSTSIAERHHSTNRHVLTALKDRLGFVLFSLALRSVG